MDQTPRKPPTLPDGQIDFFIRDRVCSRCYGDLSKRPTSERTWEVSCPACGDAWGFTTISRHTAERRGQQALSELYEVKQNLPDLFPRTQRTEKQTLSELGY